MVMEIDEEEAAKQKQKRMEGGDSPDPKRTKVVDKIKEEEEEEEEDSVSEMSEDSDVEVEEEEKKEWVRPPLTVEQLEKQKKQEEDHKVWKAERSKRLIEDYGTDDSEEIYWIIEEKRAAYDALCALQHHHKEEEDEPELDENEIQRVNNILNDVEDRTRPISHIPRTQDHLLLPQDFFLLAPWVDADCTRNNQNGKARTLSMYYKRLFPAVESACGMAGPYSWNRLPEVDAEYLSLYSKLCDLVEEDHKSWFLYVKSSLTRRSDYLPKAREMAKQLNLQRLKERDIHECLQNVFKEGDTIAEHKLKEEYDMHLLACEFDPLRRMDFKPKEPTPIIDSMVCFNAVRQRSKFDMWMEEKKALNWTKDQCREELVALHAKNLRQYCGTRIRFIKYKRAWAKNLGIISE